jgi:ribose 5-phosphate isomerase A
MDLEALKREAARYAVMQVRDHMRLGLGTGSTARHFVDLLGERIKQEKLHIVGVPTSEVTYQQALSLGIPLTTLDETPELDLTVDGADEIDPALHLIKGGGGAHLREKMVALASKRVIIIADETKNVARLGRFPLPLEVVSFGLAATQARLRRVLDAQGCHGALSLRKKSDGSVFVTDSGHVILDASCAEIADAAALAQALDGVTGLVEHGLFIGLASAAVLATSSGIRVMGDLA